MTVTQRTIGTYTVLDLTGRFEFSSRKVFSDSLKQAQETGATHIILNLQGVPFVDSAALGLLSLAHQNLKGKNGKLVLANPQKYVQNILELANFPKFLSIHHTIDEALASRTTI